MPSPGTVLSTIRVLIGIGGWGAPSLTAKLFGLDPKGNPQALYLARLFAVRDLGLAVSANGSSGPARKLAWQIGIACDLADGAAALIGGRTGSIPKQTAISGGATALVAAGLGVAALAQGE